MRRTAVPLALWIAAAGCGGGGGSPSGPTAPPIPAGSSVTLVLFYDENANGVAEVGEVMRVPDVQVSLGARSARSETFTGRAVVSGVQDGSYTASLRTDTLPPFYQPGAAVSVQVPATGSQFFVPLVVNIGKNNPGHYLAFGDSITRGDGSLTGGYPARLQGQLTGHFAWANVRNRGADATNSYEALERLNRNLFNDAFALILYGTNDWNIPGCQDLPATCPTVENLRIVVRRVKSVGTLPFLATLPPVNPAVNADRNLWVASINNGIRTMAAQEGAFLVDLYQAFQNQGGDLSRFFADGVHPNDSGYDVIANAFFQAIAHGRTSP